MQKMFQEDSIFSLDRNWHQKQCCSTNTFFELSILSCTSSCSAQHGWLLQGHAHCLGAGWGPVVARWIENGLDGGSGGPWWDQDGGSGTTGPPPRLRWNRATEHNPGLQSSKQSQTHPLGFYPHWNLWPWSPHPFLFSHAAALYLHMGRTDWVIHRLVHSERSMWQCTHLVSSNLLVFNLQLSHTTSNLLVYNLQLSYMLVQPVSVYLFEVMIWKTTINHSR